MNAAERLERLERELVPADIALAAQGIDPEGWEDIGDFEEEVDLDTILLRILVTTIHDELGVAA